MGRRELEQLQRYADRAVVDEIQLLVSELVTNSLKHAGLRPEDSIEVRVDVHPRAIRVTVGDPGPGFQSALLSPGANGSGWGLLLVERIADGWGVNRTGNGTEVWFEVPRSATRP